jgi:transposase
MKNHNTKVYSTPIQLKLPVDLERIIKINDPVYSFSEVMAHIDLKKYFVEEKEHETGCPRYSREKLLKIVLFAFMEFGYCSVRFIQKLCETDIRFLWLLDEAEAPSHTKINDFIKYELAFSLEEIFDDINSYIFSQLNVDLNHAYIDGTKIEANANGMAICFNEQDVRPMGRDAAGVRGITLTGDDCVIGAEKAEEGKTLLTVTVNGFGKRTEVAEYLRTGPGGEKVAQSRGGKGLKNYNITAKTGKVAGCRVVDEKDDVMLIENGGVIIRVPASDINVYKRDVQGVIVMRIEEGNEIVSIERVPPVEEEQA